MKVSDYHLKMVICIFKAQMLVILFHIKDLYQQNL